MNRTARAVLAVALMFATVILSKRMPAPATNGHMRRCEIPNEPSRPLDLHRFADRSHLRGEAAAAESWAIAYADVSPHRQQGLGPYAEVREQCMATLFARISHSHAIDVSTVREYAQQRDVVFDAAVILVFFFAYLVIAYHLAGVIMRRFTGDGRFAQAAAVIIASVMTVSVAVLVGDGWSIVLRFFGSGMGISAIAQNVCRGVNIRPPSQPPPSARSGWSQRLGSKPKRCRPLSDGLCAALMTTYTRIGEQSEKGGRIDRPSGQAANRNRLPWCPIKV
jgi:hypothetical protein